MDEVEARAGDPRFFECTGPISIAAIAAATGAEPSFDDGRLLARVAPLQRAGASDLSFLDNRRYAPELAASRAGAVILHPDMARGLRPGIIALISKDPYRAWAVGAALLHPYPKARAGIHPSAGVDETATIDTTAEIGPFAVIGAGAEIGRGCIIGPHAVVGAGVRVGNECRLGAHASVTHTMMGNRVYIYPGARIGQEGFGFVSSTMPFLTVPQLGRVILEDDVEIGANSTIDRGSAQDTVIGAGSRLDNLVQIGHNVRLGRCCVIVSHVGISGSTILEDFVMIGGQAGLAGHLKIGRGARIGAQAGVMSDVVAGAEVIGTPAEPLKDFWRRIAVSRRLSKSVKAVPFNTKPGSREPGDTRD